MKLTFKVEYRTVWGESIHVLINDDEGCVQLTSKDGYIWEGSYDIALPDDNRCITYRYGVFINGKCTRKEFGAIPHSFYLGNIQQSHYIIDDVWRDLPSDDYRYSSAFNSIHTPSEYIPMPNSVGSCITFRALCPGLDRKGQVLGIIGSGNALGNWQYYRPIRMTEVQQNVWHTTFSAKELDTHMEYKFVAINASSGSVEEWETGENRKFDTKPLSRGETYVKEEAEVFFNQPVEKIAGSAIPVFSLRSEGSWGVGDFGDLKSYIDWAALTHQKAVQILPINDTTMTGTWQDSYPYNSISIYAFNPIYIDPRQVEPLESAEEMEHFEKKRKALNDLPAVDYEATAQLKREYFKKTFTQSGKYLLEGKDFVDFFAHNEEWLKNYAAFSYLRDKYNTSDFSYWPEYSVYSKEEVEELCSADSPAYEEISFYYYVQYLLHVQLLRASNHARNKGVIFKGDIPIGISRGSVEAWVEPYYFNMNGQAGAPPDFFSTNGQNWGFPTYNWDVMEKDNYLWWRKRFAKMSEYFTAYRIDHILGFFRIWEIPIHSVHGILGQFVPSQPMSVEEIRSFGLNFRKDFMTQPYIDDRILTTMFVDDSEYVIKKFLKDNENGTYSILPEFDTQRKVEAYFYQHPEEKQSLKEGLYSLISNVLFVEDRKEKGTYHPRISVQTDFVFKQLNAQEQDTFNHLYEHYFYQRHNEFWYQEAMKKLPVLTQSTPMLVCGEDLGMVPGCVPWLMNNLQILSLSIQRMPKEMWDEFGNLHNNPFHSVCTIGTHDMSTLRGWWEENSNTTTHFYNNILHHDGKAPETASGEICEEIITQHLHCPSLLCIITWQDWTAMDEELRNTDIESERINIPANPRHYWRWRMHIPLEELMKKDSFNEKIRTLIDESGRY